MGTLGCVTIMVSAVWVISESRVIFGMRSKNPAPEKDRLSLRILMIINGVAIAVAVMIGVAPSVFGELGSIQHLTPFVGYFGCLLILLGVIIRLAAIATLKEQFTADVSIVKNHKIVDRGLYGAVRHPAYLGGLLSFLGLGLALENWLSLVIVFFLPLAAISYRIAVEERALVDHFGDAYLGYMRRTKRLIPLGLVE